MNLSELKDRVFRMTSNTYHDQFHMRDLLNSALTMLSDEAKLEGVQSYSVTTGNASYPLPSGYKSPRALVDGTFDNPKQIYDLVTIEEVKHGYAIWNGNMIIKPTPGQDTALNFYFYKYAAQLVDDADVVESAFTDYADVVASYAAALILSLPGATEANRYLVDRYFAIWEDGKRRFKADRAKQNKQATVRLVNNW